AAAPGLPDRLEDPLGRERSWDEKAGSDRPRVGPRGHLRCPIDERPDDGSAAFGLHGIESGDSVEEAEGPELSERFRHADETGSTARRVEDSVGEALRTGLLDDLEPHRLLSLH